MSRICEAIKGEFDAWKTRDLSEVELDDLVADGSYFTMHPGAPAEPVLVAWGITTPGRSVFLGLEPGSAERTDAWASCLRGLTARGLGDPLLLTSDGGAGLIGAAELGFPRSLRRRCLIHRARTNRPSGSGSSVGVGLQPTEVVVERGDDAVMPEQWQCQAEFSVSFPSSPPRAVQDGPAGLVGAVGAHVALRVVAAQVAPAGHDVPRRSGSRPPRRNLVALPAEHEVHRQTP